MCSRLYVMLSTGGGTEITPGEVIPYRTRNSSVIVNGIWGVQFGTKLVGFARVETVREKWLAKGWQTCTIPIVDFAEGHQLVTWADVGQADLAALQRGGEVVIITRQATPAESHKLDHHRVPVQVADGRMVLPSKGGPDWLANQS